MRNQLSTSRLTLELLTRDDHEFILELINSKGWIEFIGDRHIHSKDAALEYINKIIEAPTIHYWVVKIATTNTPAGIISFLKRDYLDHYDIGFAFLPQFSGNGYALEASKEILSMVSLDHAYGTIMATTIPANEKSIKLLLKLGLHFEKEIEVGEEKLHVYVT